MGATYPARQSFTRRDVSLKAMSFSPQADHCTLDFLLPTWQHLIQCPWCTRTLRRCDDRTPRKYISNCLLLVFNLFSCKIFPSSHLQLSNQIPAEPARKGTHLALVWATFMHPHEGNSMCWGGQISWQATTSNCVSERGKPDIPIHSASFCNNVVQSQTFDR